jgi:phage shock protein E
MACCPMVRPGVQALIVALVGVGAGMTHMVLQGPVPEPKKWAASGGASADPARSTAPAPGAGVSPVSPAASAVSPTPDATTSAPTSAHQGAASTASTGSTASPAAGASGLVVPFSSPQAGQREIRTPEMRGMVGHPLVVIIDARLASEFAQGHIAGAINIPPESIRAGRSIPLLDPSNPAGLYPKMGMQFVVYCGGGDCEASKDVAAELFSRGFQNMAVDLDGTAGWLAAGQVLVKPAGPTSP